MDMGLDSSRTSDYWDSRVAQSYGDRAEWLAHPFTRTRLAQLRDGRSLEEWVIARYLKGSRVSRAIGIGCGVASFELGLLSLGAVEHFDLYDVSQGALDAALTMAQSLGVADRVRVFRQDINQVALPPNTYDLVTFISSLHHVAELQGVLHKVNETLTPGGLVFASEYVGPDRFAYPEEDAAYAKQLYRILDPTLRSPWPELPQPNPDDVAAADPTESIHSSEIIETVRHVFERVEVTPFGHALAFIIWWGLNHDALYETEQGRDLVAFILDFDNMLVESGRLSSYFSYLVAYKRLEGTTPPPPNDRTGTL